MKRLPTCSSSPSWPSGSASVAAWIAIGDLLAARRRRTRSRRLARRPYRRPAPAWLSA